MADRILLSRGYKSCRRSLPCGLSWIFEVPLGRYWDSTTSSDCNNIRSCTTNAFEEGYFYKARTHQPINIVRIAEYWGRRCRTVSLLNRVRSSIKGVFFVDTWSGTLPTSYTVGTGFVFLRGTAKRVWSWPLSSCCSG